MDKTKKTTIDIIKDPVTGKSFSRDTAIEGSTYAEYTPTTEPTAGDTYKDFNYTSPSTDLDAAYTKTGDEAKNDALSKVDEEKIRRNTLQMFQAEIDAVNDLYAQKYKEAQQSGLGNLGSATAIQARSGLLGSDFGQAQTKKVEQQNQEVLASINAEKAAKIGSIMGTVRSTAAAEIAEKRAAQQKGATDYLKFLEGQAERNATKATNVAKALLAQNLKPEEIDPTELEQIATGLGVSVQEIQQAYLAEVEAANAAELKANPAFELGEGQSRFVFDPSTGTYKEVASKAKTYSPNSGAGGGLTPYQQFQATQSIAKDNQKRTENAREMQRQANLIKSSYENIKNGGNRSLNTQAIITSFNKILDPTSVVRESEYDRTAAGQSLIAQLQGKVDNITAGGAGVTEETLKEAADIAEKYLQSAAASIKAENDRAIAMANAFGLNSEFVGTIDSNVSIQEQVDAAGYDYNAMKADGLSDDEIKAALGI